MHRNLQKLITFLKQILDNTIVHLSHSWDVEAYAPTKVSHIFETNSEKYIHALVTLLGRAIIRTHKSWSDFGHMFGANSGN